MKAISIIAIIFLIAFSQVKAQTGNCNPPLVHTHLDINNVDATLYINSLWTNDSTLGYKVPKISNIPSLAAGGLWIGGIDQGGQLRVAAETYRHTGNDYFPGPLDANGEITNSTCDIFNNMWKVNKSTIDSFKNLFSQFGATLDPSEVPASIINWPASGNPANPIAGSRNMAPFYDFNGDGMYDPTQGDYPLILGDQAVWWVFNDKGNAHTQTDGLPIGIEVHVMAYAYKGNGSNWLSNTTFYQYTIYYMVTPTLDNTYIGFWVDPDIGCNTDDYVGSDSTKDLAIAYNSTAMDGGSPSSCTLNYGNQPPIIGIAMLHDSTFLGMKKFGYTNNSLTGFDGNPGKTIDYYNYLSGKWIDSTNWTYGGNGHNGSIPANYLYPGNPSDSKEWSMCSANTPPTDVRMFLSSGPYNLNVADVKKFTIGVTWYLPDLGTYPCPDLSEFDKKIDSMKVMFKSNFMAAGIPTINQRANETVTVFPNPATDNVTMSFSNNLPKQVVLYNILGVEVERYSNVVGTSLTIQRNNLSNGIYFYKVSIKNSEAQTGKLIFQ